MLVVATPCPLILAAPIALISGVARAAGRGVIVKGGGVIEQLGTGPNRAVRQDRHADARRIRSSSASSPSTAAVADELLRLAASVDQLSAHVLAEAIVHAAQARPRAAPRRRT